MNRQMWVGIDLDGTLSQGYQEQIGPPIPQIVAVAKQLLSAGIEVRIFTARASGGRLMSDPVRAWSKAVFGTVLPVTNVKTMECLLIIDDKALSIQPNTGRFRTESEMFEALHTVIARYGKR